jgi:hypothetical protein
VSSRLGKTQDVVHARQRNCLAHRRAPSTDFSFLGHYLIHAACSRGCTSDRSSFRQAGARLHIGDRNGGGGVKCVAGDTQVSSLPFDCSSRPVTSFAGSPTELTNSTLRRAFRCKRETCLFGAGGLGLPREHNPDGSHVRTSFCTCIRVLVYASLFQRNRTSIRCSRLQCAGAQVSTHARAGDWEHAYVSSICPVSRLAGSTTLLRDNLLTMYLNHEQFLKYTFTANIFMRSLSISSTA